MSDIERFNSDPLYFEGHIVPELAEGVLAVPSADLAIPDSHSVAADNMGALLDTPLADGWRPVYPGKRRLIGKAQPDMPVYTMRGMHDPIQPDGVILERAVYRPTEELANRNADPRDRETSAHRLWPTDTNYNNFTDSVVVVERIVDDKDNKHLLIMPGTVRWERSVEGEQHLRPRAAYLISQVGRGVVASLTDYDAGHGSARELSDRDVKVLASNVPTIFDKELFTAAPAEDVGKVLVPVEFNGKFRYVTKKALVERARNKGYKFVDVDWVKPTS